MILERWLEIFLLGVKNLARNKLRSFLTMLGMIFGVGSVVAMLAVGEGAQRAILERIQELGVNNIIVNSVQPPEEIQGEIKEAWDMNRYGVTFKDAEHIRETCPAVDRILPVNLVKKRIWYGSRRLDAVVRGVEPEYLHMFHLQVRRGRLFSEIDAAAEEKVCIIRQGLTRQFESVEDPIGMTLKIGDYPFQVIGILEDEEFRSQTRSALAIDERAQEIYVPYSTSMRTFGTVTYVERAGSQEYTKVELDQIIAVARAPGQVFPAARMIHRILDHAHDRKDFEIVIPLELLQQSEQTQKVFNVVMVLIAGISLLVGGIGIANIMLATITERTREIGVRRALGARRLDIVQQFLMETTAIAVIGGLLGCLFGLASVFGIIRFTSWNAVVDPSYFLISLAISAGVGILFGIYPAQRAARMDPIHALRYE